MNHKEFTQTVAKLMAIMCQGYQSFNLTEQAIIWYADILQDVPVDALEAAAKFICSLDGQYMPSPGTWRNRAFDILMAKKNLPSAFEAWDFLLKFGDGSPIKKLSQRPNENGQYEVEVIERQWNHSLIEKAAVNCGWPNFPDPKSLSYDRDTFMKAYIDLCGQVDQELKTPASVKSVEQKYINASESIKQLAESKRPV